MSASSVRALRRSSLNPSQSKPSQSWERHASNAATPGTAFGFLVQISLTTQGPTKEDTCPSGPTVWVCGGLGPLGYARASCYLEATLPTRRFGPDRRSVYQVRPTPSVGHWKFRMLTVVQGRFRAAVFPALGSRVVYGRFRAAQHATRDQGLRCNRACRILQTRSKAPAMTPRCVPWTGRWRPAHATEAEMHQKVCNGAIMRALRYL